MAGWFERMKGPFGRKPSAETPAASESPKEPPADPVETARYEALHGTFQKIWEVKVKAIEAAKKNVEAIEALVPGLPLSTATSSIEKFYDEAKLPLTDEEKTIQDKVRLQLKNYDQHIKEYHYGMEDVSAYAFFDQEPVPGQTLQEALSEVRATPHPLNDRMKYVQDLQNELREHGKISEEEYRQLQELSRKTFAEYADLMKRVHEIREKYRVSRVGRI